MRKKIEKADKLPNPLSTIKAIPENLPFVLPADVPSSDNGSTKKFELEVMSSSALQEDTLQDVLRIFEENMGELYRISTWGLNLDEKAEELRHRKARYLIVWTKQDKEEEAESRKMAAFVHYRFCFDDDERPDWAVLYIYEIQVADGFQRKGMGQALMLLLEEVARQTQMTKVMLTVFNQNVEGMKFYRERCGYAVDDSDPSNYDERADYTILSKTV